MTKKRDPLKPILLLVFLGAVVALGWVLVRAQAMPEGPQPVVWGKQACAFCHMHVSEPAFAAQLHTATGEVLYFDDPGCLFSLERQRPRDVHARWFHHLREDRWLSGSEVGFIPVDPTPMGFGLGAVDASTPDAMNLEAAAKHAIEVPARERHHSGEGG
jgi:hypothetical protein